MITVIFDYENGIILPDVKVQEFATEILSNGDGTIVVSQMLIIDAIRAEMLTTKFDLNNITFEVHNNGNVVQVRIDKDCAFEDWEPFPEIQMKLLETLAKWD